MQVVEGDPRGGSHAMRAFVKFQHEISKLAEEGLKDALQG